MGEKNNGRRIALAPVTFFSHPGAPLAPSHSGLISIYYIYIKSKIPS